ncbi:MAG: hypothetical protein Kow0069_03160 [Promethearchaeota archaeon]
MSGSGERKNARFVLVAFGLAVGALFAFLWVPLNFAGPDGLESAIADASGGDQYEPEPPVEYRWAPFPDYSMGGGQGDSYVTSWLVGVVGAAVVLVAALAALKLLVKGRRDP